MPTILVVDDDEATRLALQALLKRHSFDVVLASDGSTGLRLIEERSCDVAIIDIFMPGMDGIATIRQLVKLDPNLPFIAMSGYAFTDRNQGAPDFLGMTVRLGATAALQKPFKSAELLGAIEHCFEVRRRWAAGIRLERSEHPAARRAS